jgi:hypothetical protein
MTTQELYILISTQPQVNNHKNIQQFRLHDIILRKNNIAIVPKEATLSPQQSRPKPLCF